MSDNELYNKYRPASLEEVKGQSHVIDLLKEYLAKDAVPHSMVFHGPAGTGKAQPLYSKIKTPNGWITMGEIEVGTKVVTPCGKVTEVIGTFDRGVKDVYEIEFIDGRTTRCCNEHLWKIFTPEEEYATVSLDWILLRAKTRKDFVQRCKVDLITPREGRHRNLPINPYLLGALLGDGCFPKGGRNITFSSSDQFIIDKLNCKLYKLGLELTHSGEYDYRMRFRKGVNFEKTNRKGETANPIIDYLRQVGLYGKKSHEKFIPEEFLHSSASQRLELLRGLLDTDGHASSVSNTASFSTTSKELSDQVVYLCRSLGFLARTRSRVTSYTGTDGKKGEGKTSYRTYIRSKDKRVLFSLPRKTNLLKSEDQYSEGLRLSMKSIRYVGRELVRCISVAHLSQLYITDEFIATHNTSTARLVAKGLNPHEGGLIEVNSASTGKVDDMRSLEREVAYYPIEGEYKIYVFDEAHRISAAGFDSLLKTVEEPPSHVKFIFVTTDRDAIPNTILSRSDVHQFNRIQSAKIRDRLNEVLKLEGLKLTDELVNLAVEAGSGSLRDSLNSLQKIIVMHEANESQIDIVKTLGIVGPKGLGDFCRAFLNNNITALKEASACFDPSIVDPVRAIHSLQQFVLDARHSILDPEYLTKAESNVEEFLQSIDLSNPQMVRYTCDCLIFLFDMSLGLEESFRKSTNHKGLIDRFVIQLEQSRA